MPESIVKAQDAPPVDRSAAPAAAGAPLALGSSEAGHDALLDKAQQLLRTIDETSSLTGTSAAPQARADAVAPALQPASIAQLDSALAADLDALLESDFQTIEAVLDGVFEEQAAMVQKLDEPPAPAPTATPPLAPPPSPASASTSPIETNPVSAAPIIADQRHVAPLGAAPPDLHIARRGDQATAAAAIERHADQMADGAQQNTVPVAGPAASVQAAVAAPPEEPVRNPIAPLAPLDERELRPELAAVRPRRPNPFKMLLGVVAQPMVDVLAILNYPLRFVPPRLRPAVDWLAVSLMAWVPVVWIMVLVLGSPPQGESPNAEADAEPIKSPEARAAPGSPANH